MPSKSYDHVHVFILEIFYRNDSQLSPSHFFSTWFEKAVKVERRGERLVGVLLYFDESVYSRAVYNFSVSPLYRYFAKGDVSIEFVISTIPVTAKIN